MKSTVKAYQKNCLNVVLVYTNLVILVKLYGWLRRDRKKTRMT